jgi:hypothetical protein
MKRTARLLFITTALGFALSSAQVFAGANIPAVFMPGKGARLDKNSAELFAEKLSTMPGVRSAVPVFEPGERAYLSAQGELGLAGAVKLELADTETLEALRLEASRKGSALPAAGRISREPMARLHSAHPEQWGLHNTGKPQEVILTDILSRLIRSVPGEDVGLAGAPAEVSTRKTLVAVIDTGVELTHPALASQIHRTRSECEAYEQFRECMRAQIDKGVCHVKFDRMDTDGNGYPLDCAGWDFTGAKDAATGLAGSQEIKDMIGHGTHVSGIIAGTGVISGIASQVEILPVKVLGGLSSASSFAQTAADDVPDPRAPELADGAVVADVVARGVLYAIRSGAQVLNLSLGYSINDDSELMRRMVALAQSRGILVVAAAGNESSRTPVYPCRYADVVCVASHSADGSVSHFSDYGDSVDLAAPGYSILSAWPTTAFPAVHTERKGYDFKNGTSHAAPFVAGALARLLNHGFAPREAYARLLLGARPSLPPTAMAELAPKFTLSGNLDLGRAFAVAPQPLILPESKDPVLSALDRQKAAEPRTSRFQLSLKNLWRPGARVDVRIAISADSPQARAMIRLADAPGGADVTSIERSFSAWGSGETRLIEGGLSWSAPIVELPGDFYLEVTVSGPGMATRTFKKSLEFIVPIRPMPLAAGGQGGDPKITRVETDLRPEQLKSAYALKPITCLPSAGRPADSSDLLLILKPGASTVLQLLARTGEGSASRLQRTGGTPLDNKKEQLFAYSCLDYDRDGKRDYVVTTVGDAAPGAEGAAPSKDKKFVLTFFDSAFRRGRDGLKLEFSSAVAPLPEDFRWLSGLGAGRELLPAFIARGRKPPSETGKFDPWDKRPPELVNAPDQRLYYLDRQGLHTIAAPKDHRFVALLKPTTQELIEGTATALLLKGGEYVADFYTAKLSGKSLGALVPLEFSIYQRLIGLKATPVLSTGASGTSGTAFSETGAAGRMRLSVAPLPASGTQAPVLPWLLEPVKPGDILTQVIATYGESGERAQSFSRSRFQLYFHDRAQNVALGTDLKQYDSITRHLPAWVGGMPALLMAEGQGSALTTELIMPRLEAGRATSLYRPASLKTWALEGCELVQMKATGFGGSGGGLVDAVRKLVYFCGDHFVEIAL